MNYPAWDVPWIGSGWVIGAIAIFHVMISHFAVGGGLYLPLAESKALREGKTAWLEQLQKHAKFFLVLTGVFGAVSGVGIWFAIGLAHPEGTSSLIHNFVFAWAMEWVVFLVELSAAAVYYYTWGRVPQAVHLRVGYVYAGASWLTLVIINGILTFMLTPGSAWLSVAGTGQESTRFWAALFNPTYWPSLWLRTLVCVSLAGIWALLNFSRLDDNKEGAVKEDLIRWSCRWLMPAFLLMPLCFFWYLTNVPEPRRDLLHLGISTIGAGTFTQVTRAALVVLMTSATIGGVVYFLAYRSPRDFAWPHASAVLLLALLATGSTEYAREMLRKPYVIGQHLYSSGIRRSEVAAFNETGYLAASPWRPLSKGAVAEDPHRLGRTVFRGQCLACHTLDGYRALTGYLHGRDESSISNLLAMLYEYKPETPYTRFMPPLVGTAEERAALVRFLHAAVAPPSTNAVVAAAHASRTLQGTQ